MTKTGERVLIAVAIILALIFVALVSQPAWAAKGGKPDPGSVVAEDVDCEKWPQVG